MAKRRKRNDPYYHLIELPKNKGTPTEIILLKKNRRKILIKFIDDRKGLK